MTHDALCSHVRKGHGDDCLMCDIRGCECDLIAKVRADERQRNVDHGNQAANDSYARLVNVAFELAASVDNEYGCCHQTDELRAGFRVEGYNPYETAPLPVECLGVATLDKWLPEWRQHQPSDSREAHDHHPG